jgi:hypothetical protein
LVSGERGIGKSSLLYYLTNVAVGDFVFDGAAFKFLVVGIELQPLTTYAEIIGKIGSELERVLSCHQRVRHLAREIWQFVARWQALGVSYKPPEKSETAHQLLEDLTQTITQVVSSITPEYDGILFLIDEADKPSATAHLGEFVKLFTERLTKRGCDDFSIGLAGLPTLTQKLRESHESAPRVFQILSLEPLSHPERIDLIRKGLARANERGHVVSITEHAENLIATLSEGYPHFIQLFAYCAF